MLIYLVMKMMLKMNRFKLLKTFNVRVENVEEIAHHRINITATPIEEAQPWRFFISEIWAAH